MMTYDPFDWHWVINGDESRFWSSAAGAYVTGLPAEAGVTRIGSEEELTDVLAVYELPGPIFRFPELKPYQWDAILPISGMKAVVDTTLDALPEPDRTVAKSRNEKSLTYRRDDPLLLAMMQAAQLTDQEVDSLWLWAAEL